MWDLFKQQPIKLRHPAGFEIPVAAVSPIKNGVAWWSANYLIAAKKSGMLGGSGFPLNPVYGVPEWSEQDKGWKITNNGRVYLFVSPDKEMLKQWKENEKYIAPLEDLHTDAAEQYGEPD